MWVRDNLGRVDANLTVFVSKASPMFDPVLKQCLI